MATLKKKAKKPTKRMRPGRLTKNGSDKLTAIQRQFLEALASLGEIKAASEAISINRARHYRQWLKIPVYKAAYEEIIVAVEKQRADDVLEELRKRALDGYEEETAEQELEAKRDKDGGYTMQPTKQRIKRHKKYSDVALVWLANKHHGNPSRLEVTGKDGGPIEHRNKALETLVERLDAMAIKLNGGSGKQELGE